MKSKTHILYLRNWNELGLKKPLYVEAVEFEDHDDVFYTIQFGEDSQDRVSSWSLNHVKILCRKAVMPKGVKARLRWKAIDPEKVKLEGLPFE